jgi:glycosyltransferase 2 family protein
VRGGPELWRRAFHWAGSGLAIVGVAFVAFRLCEYWPVIEMSRLTATAWALLAALAFLYGVADLVLALGWWYLLNHLGVQATRVLSIRTYGISQLAKYLPGNIFHLAGRQALGMAAGLERVGLAKSAVWELALIAVAGLLYGWLILPLLWPEIPGTLSVFLFLGSALVAAHLLRTSIGAKAAVSFGLQMFFLAISGALFVAILELIVGSSVLSTQTLVSIGSAYVVAWLAGLTTPGTPAGLGVREAVLLLLLKGVVVEGDLLLAVLLGRVVTVVGDVLFFAFAFLYPYRNALRNENHA